LDVLTAYCASTSACAARNDNHSSSDAYDDARATIVAVKPSRFPLVAHARPACEGFLDGDGLRMPQWLADGQARVVKQGPHRIVYRVEFARPVLLRQA